MEPKFPEVVVKLVGNDGNAFAIVGRVRGALRKAGYRDEAEAYMKAAFSGDYDNLLRLSMEYVTVR